MECTCVVDVYVTSTCVDDVMYMIDCVIISCIWWWLHIDVIRTQTDLTPNMKTGNTTCGYPYTHSTAVRCDDSKSLEEIRYWKIE